MPAVTGGFAGALRERIRQLLKSAAGGGVPRVVAFGVDTLYVHWKVPLASDLVARLRALQAEAAAVPLSEGGAIPVVELGRHRFDVKGHASRQAPIFLHAENVMDVHLNPTPAIDTMPTVAIELRSVELWQHGAHQAVQDALAVLEALLPDGVVLPEAQLVPQVTRIDVCADFQFGEVLKEHPQLLYPARVFNADPNAPGLRCRADKFDTHYDGVKSTGVSYGKKTSDISAGVYNKSVEILESSLKTWFEDVWKQSPNYVAGEEVWRLEFRLKRDGLRSLQCPDVKRELLTWPDVAEHLEAIWRYLSGEWLVWRGQRTKHSRNTIDARWRPLHELDVGELFHQGCATVLRKKIEKIGEMATAQTCGYLAQMKAHIELELGRDVSLEDAVPIVLDKVKHHGEESGRTVEMRCKERREKFDRLIAGGLRVPATAPPARAPHGWKKALDGAEVVVIERKLRRELRAASRRR